MSDEPRLNRNGNRRGMTVNSHKNIYKALAVLQGNDHAKKKISITRIQRKMLGELCPFAKDPSWTWAYALAEAGMRDALTDERARENLKDRLEGKMTLPVEGVGNIHIKYVLEKPDSAITPYSPPKVMAKASKRVGIERNQGDTRL